MKHLFLCYVCVLISITGFSQTATAPSEGNGSSDNPYRIATLENLYWLSQTTSAWTATSYVIQTADIDASVTNTWFADGSGGYYGFPPIASSATGNGQVAGTFSGNYDGQGYTISNLYINRTNDQLALFGRATNLTLRNINLENATVICRSTTTANGVAILLASVTGGTLDNIHVYGGSVSNGNSTNFYGAVGAIMGRQTGNVNASDCSSSATVSTNAGGSAGFTGYSLGGTVNYTNCSVTGTVTATGARIGGFLGQTGGTGTQTFTNCSVRGNVSGGGNTGGFIGLVFSTMRFNNCYATGSVIGTGNYFGGFYGWVISTVDALFTNCYASGPVGGSGTTGGFGTSDEGLSSVVYVNCFWDTENSGKVNGLYNASRTGLTGRTTAQMKTQATFTGAGWDFVNETANGTSDTWFRDATDNNGYPSLSGNGREWTGASNSNWNNAANWKYGLLPNTGSIVTIGADATNLPAVNAAITVGRFSFNGMDYTPDLGNYNFTCSQVLAFGANRYIKTSGTGVLAMNVSNNRHLTFPVGNNAFNPVEISNRSGSDDVFTVYIVDDVFANGTDGVTVDKVRLPRTWNITKATANGGSGVNFLFKWNTGEPLGSLTNAKMHHNSGSGWEMQSGTTTASSTSLYYTGYTGSFSPFSIMDENMLLPVTWLAFSGRLKNNETLLSWRTANEQQTDRYIIQRSKEGVNWQPIGTVEAAGNSHEAKEYTFTDNAPIPGQNYYRLLQKDQDGHISYSKVIVVALNETLNISVYPNPVTNGTLQIQVDHPVLIQLYTKSGTLMLSRKLNAGTHQLQTSSLSKGSYILKAGEKSFNILLQ